MDEEHHGQAIPAWMLTTAGVLATEGRQQQQTYSKEYQGSNSVRTVRIPHGKEREEAGRFRLFLNNFYGLKIPLLARHSLKLKSNNSYALVNELSRQQRVKKMSLNVKER
jgi:hypothetical protein